MSLVTIPTTLTVIFSVSLAHKDAVFVQKPQNHTIFNSRKLFVLNCSTDIASEYGMDWVVQINGIRERVCSSQDFYINGSNSCLLNYSMEVPNNRTLNLIVDPQIASLGDVYCCQFDNGAGKKSCSHLTISLTSDPVGDHTVDPRFADSTTVHGKNIAAIVGIIVVGAVLIIVVVAVVAIYLILKKCRSKKHKISNGAGTDAGIPLNSS